MSKQYFAVNRIVHGNGDAGESVFEPGQQVTGLSKDAMVSLWNAGVLREIDPEAESTVTADERDQRIADLEQQLAEARSLQVQPAPSAEEPTEREPEDVPGGGASAGQSTNTAEAAAVASGTSGV
jgi:hypothetical protein